VCASLLALIDFTKQYNRLRQHVAVRTGNAQGIMSSINHSASVAPLPVANHPRTASLSKSKDKTTDQLAALAKYSSRLAAIDEPYFMGVGVNRKGPSSYANAKDKSDRATNEQVLDPRTRIILFKMIGRGLIREVNGCISTGKEVSRCLFYQIGLF
jgi:RIO kinase 1